MIYFHDYFIRNLIWSSLIHFEQSDQKIEIENVEKNGNFGEKVRKVGKAF